MCAILAQAHISVMARLLLTVSRSIIVKCLEKILFPEFPDHSVSFAKENQVCAFPKYD